MQPIHNVAIVGSGHIGQKYKALLQRMPHVSIKAVVASPTAALHQNLIEQQDIDAVVIAETDSNPLQLIDTAIKADKFVFCGHHILPLMKIDLSSSSILTNLIDENHVKLQIGFRRRFDPHYAYLKKQIEEGMVGNIHIVKITNRYDAVTELPTGKHDTFMFNMHDFDMAHFITGQMVDEVFAMTTAKYQDASVITLRMKNGAFVIIDSSPSVNYGNDQRLEVFGEKGALIVDNLSLTNTHHYSHRGVMTEKPSAKLDDRYQHAYQAQLHAFFNSLTHGKQVMMPTAKDVIVAIRVAEAAQCSVIENRPVKV